jgi:hypothetical protein
MRDDDHTPTRAASLPISRRRVLAGVGALATGGVTYATVGATPAAAVETTGFMAEDATASVPADTNPEPELTATGPWSFDRTTDADEIMVALLVDEQLIADTEQSVSAPADSGDYELTGTVTDARAYDPADFSPPQGGTREVDMTVEVRLEVRDARGQSLVTADASDDLTLTIDDAGITVKANIGGNATVSVPSDTSDE